MRVYSHYLMSFNLTDSRAVNWAILGIIPITGSNKKIIDTLSSDQYNLLVNGTHQLILIFVSVNKLF